MMFSYFFARRILFQRGRAITRLALVLAVLSVGLGISVMLLASSITAGFETAVKQKIIGYVGDMHITTYGDYGQDSLPRITSGDSLIQSLQKQFPAISSASGFIIREGILQSSTTLEGVQFKGVSHDWNSKLFQESLLAGKVPTFHSASNYSTDILLSKKIANLLEVQVGQQLRFYILEDDRVRMRKLTVQGIFETGVVDFDQRVVFGDVRLLRRLMGWQANEVAGFDVHLAHSSADTTLAEAIDQSLGTQFQALTTMELYPNLFLWLDLQHQNVLFILILMAIVAIINMSTAIIIVISERRPTIALLKTLGATPNQVQGVFWWYAVFTIVLGICAGNALAFSLLWLQDTFQLFRLDQESYFVKYVPVGWPWDTFIGINIAVTLLCALMMSLPTRVVMQIHPARTLS
jgi:lipoprotein-releasing system permease protein